MPASKSFDATTLLGIWLDFGIITVLMIDGAATGAWKKFDQTSYIIDPQCSTPVATMPSTPTPNTTAQKEDK
ncbi:MULTISPECIES: hypothetical protein [Nitrosomonas]|uniref:hypothetical protein n=1 Tax=Nitrosomonas TaxID=914 RepID=UPI00190FD35D|nr:MULTISPECIES: hypothetical protein [Nitrosomonas]UVS61353.1 hypothetical protein NX761_18080 [Nitrosomonas sp. PLL12]